MSDAIGLYIHIPFCDSKCYYCDFYSRVKDDFTKQIYVNELLKEIKLIGQECNKKIDTIYLGGGTPSILDIKLIEEICNCIFKSFDMDLKEFTIEINPDSSNDLQYYKNFGINRISLGIQSLDDKILKSIGRKHNKQIAISSLENAKKYCDNISADLILGLSEDQNVKNDISIIKNFVNHFSCYLLKIEKNTALQRMIEKEKYILPKEETTIKQYKQIYEILERNGFYRYETSNFSKTGFESKHNMKYWEMDEYIGFGPSAHSYYKGKRYYNTNSIEKYLSGWHSGYEKQINEECDELYETIMLGFRLDKGLNIEVINKKFNIDFFQKYKDNIKKMKNYLEIEENNIRIKKEYFLLQNSIIVEFL